MIQIHQLSAPCPAYPETVNGLETPERAFLLAVRWWVADRQSFGHSLVRIRNVLRGVDAASAAPPLDRFMTIAAHSASRRVVTYCPCTPHVGEDEKHLLHAASLVQNGQSELAAQRLHTAMLTMDGAVLALGPLEEVGERFAKARLLFRRRETPPVDATFPRTVEGWISSLSGTTLH